MAESEALRGRVSALLKGTEMAADFDEVGIAQELERRHGASPPDPIPDFWAVVDRHRLESPSSDH